MERTFITPMTNLLEDGMWEIYQDISRMPSLSKAAPERDFLTGKRSGESAMASSYIARINLNVEFDGPNATAFNWQRR